MKPNTAQGISQNSQALGMDVLMFGFGLGLASATQVRLSAFPVGVGESFMLCGIGFSLLNLLLARQLPIHKGVTPMAVALGFLISAIMAGWILSLLAGNWNPRSGPRDAMAYGFSLLIITSILLQPNPSVRLEAIIKIMMYVSVGGLSLILLMSLLLPSSSFLSISPWSGIRFVGWAKNPNQIALAIGSVPFIAYYFGNNSNRPLRRRIATSILILSMVIGFATLSDAMALGWVAAASSMLLLWLLGHEKHHLFSVNVLLRLLLAALILLIMVVAFRAAIITGIDDMLVAENSQASTRLLLWKNGLSAFLDSPIVGHGPGAYSWTINPSNLTEAHNTFIDLAASSGSIGLGALLYLIVLGAYRSFRARDAGLFGCIMYLTVFSMFHFMLRHPLFWMILLFVVLRAHKMLRHDAARPIGTARKHNRLQSKALTE